MNEETSAGREVIQHSPAGFRKRTADSKGHGNIWFAARPDPWKNHCVVIPRECPSARVFRFRDYDTVSRGRGEAIKLL
ncbi:MAG: hypothetical protein KKH04_18960 [Proteobacteria bacterium]|nr:hypothetical protein [Pseudomonadota bacterium]